MPRWLWFAPFGFLLLIAGYNGIKLGLDRANVTETAVINHYAAEYLNDHRTVLGREGALSDCLAIPGADPGVWLEVRCTPDEGPAFIYGVKRNGALAYEGRDGVAPEA